MNPLPHLTQPRAFLDNKAPVPVSPAPSVPSQLQLLGQHLSSFGRGQDSLLAHITPREALILHRMGGSGSINPHTGLLEFFDSSGKGDAGSEGGGGADHSGGGHAGEAAGGQGQGGGGSASDKGAFGSEASNGPAQGTMAAKYAMPHDAWGEAFNAVSPLGLQVNSTYATERAPATTSLSMNPGAALGSLAGLFAPGAGLLAGYLGGKLYSGLGGEDLALGSWGANGSVPTDGSQLAAANGYGPGSYNSGGLMVGSQNVQGANNAFLPGGSQLAQVRGGGW